MDGKIVQGIGHVAKHGDVGIQVQESTFIHYVGAVKQGLYRGVDGIFTDTGQESQPAKINAQHGNVLISYITNRIQEGTITAKAHQAVYGKTVQVFRAGKGMGPFRELHMWLQAMVKRLIDHRGDLFSL